MLKNENEEGTIMKMKMLKLTYLMLVLVMVLGLALSGCSAPATSGTAEGDKSADAASTGAAFGADPNEEYYMVTFLSGIEYWKGCYKGFEDAGKLYGVKTVYAGAAEYNVNQAVTVFEQIIANKPAGIAVTCINPDAYKEPIKKAMDAGIPVVTFDADSPDSGRNAFLATGNKAAGATAAKYLAEALGGKGDVAVVTLPGQLNHEERTAGFVETIETSYPDMKVVQIGNGGGEQTSAAQAASGILQANPSVMGLFCTDATSGVGAVAAISETNRDDVKIVSFDTDKGTLDAIKDGSIEASIAQGTWNMGFWAFQMIFQLKHDLINPTDGWAEKGINPLPPYVDTGVSVVTKDNVDAFYVSE
jgi:ribose transport system substrate-binding protein